MMQDILKEFKGLSNEQAYVNIFSKRMMKPIPNKAGEFFGTDQRIDMLPSIKRLVAKLPENGQAFDVGAGAGDVVDFALKDAPSGTTINIEEPNPALVKAYLNKLKRYPHLKQGVVYEGFLQDYYQGKKVDQFPKQPQNLVLAIHMIYHLTDFMTAHIHPETDLIEAVSFLYGLLAPGGSIFIVYADLLPNAKGEAICSLGEKFFRQRYPKESFADNMLAIDQARNKLLGPNGTIADILHKRFPKTHPTLHSERKLSHFFGDTVEDLAVLALAAELCPSDNKPFDLSKLQFCFDYITRNAERVGLQKEQRDVPQKGMWRANEPQILATITSGR